MNGLDAGVCGSGQASYRQMCQCARALYENNNKSLLHSFRQFIRYYPILLHHSTGILKLTHTCDDVGRAYLVVVGDDDDDDDATKANTHLPAIENPTCFI